MGFIKTYAVFACVIVLAACLLFGHSTSDDPTRHSTDRSTAATAETMPPADKTVTRARSYIVEMKKNDDSAMATLSSYMNWQTLTVASVCWFAVFPFIGIGQDARAALARRKASRTAVQNADQR